LNVSDGRHIRRRGVMATVAAKTERTCGRNIWNPHYVARCVCGWSARATAKAISAVADRHVADGCEGCDHAYYVEEVR
jgi:hypothetical protein